MKTYHKRKSLSEEDTLKAVRHLNGRRITPSIKRLAEYLSTSEWNVSYRMKFLVKKGLIAHKKNKISDYVAVKLSPPPLNVPLPTEPDSRKKNQTLVAFAEDYGFEGKFE